MKKIIALVITLSLVITMFASVTAFAAVTELYHPKGDKVYSGTAKSEIPLSVTSTTSYSYVDIYFNQSASIPADSRYWVLEADVDIAFDKVGYFNAILYGYAADLTTKVNSQEIRAAEPTFYATGDHKLHLIYDKVARNVYLYVDNKLSAAMIKWSGGYKWNKVTLRLGHPANTTTGTKLMDSTWKQRFFADCSFAELASSLGLTAGTAEYDSASKEYTLSHDFTQIRSGEAIGSLAKFNANGSNNNFTEEATTFIYVAGYDSSNKMVFAKKVPYDYNAGQSATVACNEKADSVKMFLLMGANLVPLTEQLAVENL